MERKWTYASYGRAHNGKKCICFYQCPSDLYCLGLHKWKRKQIISICFWEPKWTMICTDAHPFTSAHPWKIHCVTSRSVLKTIGKLAWYASSKSQFIISCYSNLYYHVVLYFLQEIAGCNLANLLGTGTTLVSIWLLKFFSTHFEWFPVHHLFLVTINWLQLQCRLFVLRKV